MSNSTEKIILGENENAIEVIARKSARARRISIRISSAGIVQLVIPKRASLSTAISFLKSREIWIRSKTLHIKPAVNFAIGNKIPIQGAIHTITHSGKMRGITHIDGDNLVISGPESSAARKVKQFLSDLAKTEISARAKIESEKIGVKYSSISVRDTTSRWGSCSSNGNLSFSWRLILADKAILQYVVAHEVAHLIELNHSKKFWDIVASLYPDYESARKWLKNNGDRLHGFG